MTKLQRLYDILGRHKYLVTILVIVLIVAFIDDNSWWNRRQREQHIQSLSKQIRNYDQQYKNDTYQLNRLKNKRYLERYAREHYHMKRADEDVYVIDN